MTAGATRRADCVLLHIAQQLQQVARGTDTVCGLGGDELLRAAARVHLVDVQQIATRVLAACAAPVLVAPGGFAAGVQHQRAACACFQSSTGLSDLLRHADSALYQAKEAGRGQVVYYQVAVPP